MTLSLSLGEYRSYESAAVDFSGFTVLVGPNGVGKTSVLHSLHVLSQLPHQDWYRLLAHERSITSMHRFGAESPLRIEVSEAGPDGPMRAWLTHEPHPNKEGQTIAVAGWQYGSKPEEFARNVLEFKDAPRPLTSWLRSTVLLRLSAREISRASFDRPEARMEYNGYRLPTVLAHLKLSNEDVFNGIVDGLRAVVPSVRAIKPLPVELARDVERVFDVKGERIRSTVTERVTGHRLYFDTDEAQRVDARSMSEGTLVTLGLVAMLRMPNRPNWVLLDDVDQALHPQAQEALIRQIHQIVQSDSSFRVIATTHSPFVVDAMDPGDVRVVGRTRTGSKVRRLDEHPMAERGLMGLTAGEFWASEGESWIEQIEDAKDDPDSGNM